MKKKISWQEQLAKATEYNDDRFGANVEWSITDVIKYVSKFEEKGALEIKIPDSSTIKFTLPKSKDKQIDLLLFIVTNESVYGRMPSTINHNKKKSLITLDFDW